MTIKVLIVDDQALLRTGFQYLLVPPRPAGGRSSQTVEAIEAVACSVPIVSS